MTQLPNHSLPTASVWLRGWARMTVVVTFVLLALGSIVTTFKVGMADPIWPTEPWFLLFINWREEHPGFLIEHAHRAVAFAVGGIVALLTVFTWLGERRTSVRWLGLVALVGLLTVFGLLHRELMRNNTVPTLTIAATLSCFVVATGCALSGIKQPGGVVRFGVVLSLGAVMIQGLLGGLRVRLNAWFGTDLAALHGILAQLVFALLTAVTVLLCATRRPEEGSVHGGIRWLAWGCVALLVVQLIWGAVLRHTGWLIMQRLHFLTAFVAVAGLVWLSITIAARPVSWREFRGVILLAGALLGFQLLLGVETWFSKFSRGVAPEMQVPVTTVLAATIRTLHVLTGAALLATLTVLATRTTLAATVTDLKPTPQREEGTPLIGSWA